MTTSKEEILEALARSGYLLEAEVSKILSGRGFFVESNVVIQDPFTGKSREIDIAAEYYDHDSKRAGRKAKAKIEYVFEIKNNSFPLVLLNEFEVNPRVEDWLGVKQIVTTPENVEYEMFESFYDQLIEKHQGKIFTQYCSFQRKRQNDDLMALHPDIIHTGISKIIQYCDECVDRWSVSEEREKERPEEYLRHFLYLPILLIQDELYEFKMGSIEQVNFSILTVNYHRNEDPMMAYVFVVTRKGLPDFIEFLIQLENEVDEKLFKARHRNA